MATTNLHQVSNLLLSTIRQINQEVSPVDSTYTFRTDLSKTTERGIGFLPNVNNTLEAYLRFGIGRKIYHSQALIHETRACSIVLFSFDVDPITVIFDAIEDVKHIIKKSHSIFIPQGINKCYPEDTEYGDLVDDSRWSAEIKLDLEYALDHSRV